MKKVDFFKFLKNNMAPIITALIILLLALLAFVTLYFGDWNEIPWDNFFLKLFLLLLMTVIWIPEGKKKGELDPKYIKNRALLDTKMAIVATPTFFDDLDAFCKVATEENRQAATANLLAKAKINYNIWLEKQGDSDWLSKLTKKQKNALKWLSAHTVEVEEIKATELTSNSIIKQKYDVKNHEKEVTGVQVAIKVISTAAMTFICSLPSFDGATFSMSALAEFTLWIVTVLCAVYFSLTTGFNLVTEIRGSFIVRNIDFLERFDGWLLKQSKTTVTEIQSQQSVKIDTTSNQT